MNSDQILLAVKQQLSNVIQDFEAELQILGTQNVLTDADIQRLRNQAEVSRDAMLETIGTKEFDDRARDKLLRAFVQDFQSSVERILENAVARKGDRALLAYKLNRIEKGIVSDFRSASTIVQPEDGLFSAMALTRAYIWRSIEASGWREPKINVQRITDDYRAVLVEFMQSQKQERLSASVKGL